jgi:hypothetical protein
MKKIYKLLGIETAMYLLRPGASWECDGQKFTRWEDERPCPTMQEVYETIDKIKAFEDSINTIYTAAQLEEMGIKEAELEKAIGDAA